MIIKRGVCCLSFFLDDNALDAVAGGVGDIGVDTKIKTDLGTGESSEQTTIKK